MGSNSRTIKSVENALDIIDVLKERDGATLSELADSVGLSPGTVHTYLTTFAQQGYVDKQGGNEYALDLEFLHLGSHIRERIPIYKHGKSAADELAWITGDVTQLAVESGGVVHILYSTRGDKESLKGPTPSGGTLPMHVTAAGKAILAELPDAHIESIIDEHGLEPFTEYTIADRAVLVDELSSIRETGYARNDEEQTIGATTLAKAVHRPDGSVVGSIGVSGTVGRFETKDTDTLVSELTEAANQIEINIHNEIG
ncbi:IclR family transcriptional regulator [Halorarum halobium]|uniref:IclR family transcriptional regulator n=1 Tax=Halorarum halobium TaxID=3075121 RepID=UPI0028AA2FB0|nr:IclR family transcriptional regulator [Halobaculum sp. XH14]